MVSDVNCISSEPCAFVGPSHECTAFVTPRIWVLGRDKFSGIKAYVEIKSLGLNSEFKIKLSTSRLSDIRV
ncbi:hypothetical protein SLEP1_g51794 [Rubroshorea leprosula]|uniref:Uncharacterized protein n=1 Tax=Rubroshorea leprosula TaxID=152421 RepID=A0AAV5M7N3_9ROSI|nr:hypothetical protein SLEP1_g51794 [Rubroshorea leprosula]